ncbi:unnamed protein product [Sphenostylis stenocarpa]|uniref:Uncharacterized protein n=1 Tax=Sphenostylis stenocarpa TaxID=92480 RepID=A0AA86VVE2_9FABA|nr:unnamed protein product [Sphenostylis stenocarpa]
MPLGERLGDKSDSRYCGVETDFNDDMPHVFHFNFWKLRFRCCSFGKISSRIDLDSEDETLRRDSETTLKQEIAWASHLSLQACLLPAPKGTSCANYARCVIKSYRAHIIFSLMMILRKICYFGGQLLLKSNCLTVNFLVLKFNNTRSSRFAIFFPLRTPVCVGPGSILEVHFWRCCGPTKVWYERCVGTGLGFRALYSVEYCHNVYSSANQRVESKLFVVIFKGSGRKHFVDLLLYFISLREILLYN